MSSRKAKPIDILLKMKQIDPSINFIGADAAAYQDFIDSQAEEKLMETLKENKPQKTVKKVKQTIDPAKVETGAMEPKNETEHKDTATEVPAKEDDK